MTPRGTLLPTPSIIVLALAVATGACSSGSEESGTGGSGGTAGAPANGGSGPAGSGGSTGVAGTTGIAGSGPAGAPGLAGSGPAGSGGSAAGTAGSTAGAGGSTGIGGATAGRGGSAAGAGGTAGAGGATAGRGGSAAGGSGIAGATAGRGGTGVGGAPAGGSTGTTGCPSNATFCSGFEESTQPAGSVYKVNAAPGEWTRDFAVDTAQKKNGNSSLRVKSASDSGTSGSSYRMLAVPAPTGVFWARFWLRSDVDLGGDHNAFTSAAESDDPNASSIEFGEDVGIAFNTKDDVRWPAGYGRLTSGATNPYKLTKNTWYCIELSFDATAKIQQAYVNGTQLINATNYPSMPGVYKTFKFGFVSFHGPDRHMWYDDVAVAPTRVGGCPTP